MKYIYLILFAGYDFWEWNYAYIFSLIIHKTFLIDFYSPSLFFSDSFSRIYIISKEKILSNTS